MADIKNSPHLYQKETCMQKISIHEYDDIINLEYPLKNFDTTKHPRMSHTDRAKIFAPFSALKGYEEAIAAKQRKHSDL